MKGNAFVMSSLRRGDVLVQGDGEDPSTYLILESAPYIPPQGAPSRMWHVEWIEIHRGVLSGRLELTLPRGMSFIYSDSTSCVYAVRGAP